MADLNLQSVRIVVAEPTSEMGAIVHQALVPRGLRELVICRDPDSMAAALEEGLVDILLCDIQLPGLKFRETMQQIRRHEIGSNPFVQIVAMVGLSGQDQIRRVIGAGVDDLIRKPMPISRLVARLDFLTRPRRPFVIAEAYIGPNRRKGPRVGDRYAMMTVPSSLRCKTVERMHPTQVMDVVARAWTDVAEQMGRLRRDAIGVLAYRVTDFYNGHGTQRELRRDLNYLVSKAEDIIAKHRHEDTVHVAEIAACMTGVARRIMQSPLTPKRADVRLIPHLADATRLSNESPDESVEQVREIVGLIRDYLRLH